MFVRAKRSVQTGRTYEYLQICQAFRQDGKPRQKVIATLGRLDSLVSSGELDAVIGGLARFSENVRVVEEAHKRGLHALCAKPWAAPLVFSRLWRSQGLPEILRRLAGERAFGFDVERVAFVMALQRLMAPGSDRAGSEWVKTVELPEAEEMPLHRFYRTCGVLGEVREDLERELFAKDRDLFSEELDLVFVDTTSTLIYRDSLKQTPLRKRGYSRDHRGDLPQIVLCVAVDRKGWPVAWDILPGNTADKEAFVATIAKLRRRFHIRRAIVVADRGMLSRQTLHLLAGHKSAPFEYILGCPLRREKEVREQVLGRAGRYKAVDDALEVKEVFVEGRRYVVCRNPQEAERDCAARTAILEKLEQTLLRQGVKAVIGNKGYARFLSIDKSAVEINQAAVDNDARLDGKFVLATNTKLPPEEVAKTYKGLWRVERTFREQKSTLEVRPIFHHSDANSVGHIVASFLALRLEVDLQRRLEQRGADVEWATLMRDLSQVQAVHLDMNGRSYLLRTDLAGSAHLAFAAAGVRPPPTVTRLS
jgi:hypothetical protein